VFLCPFLIAPSVFSNVYLNSDGIKSTNIKQSEQSSLTLIELTEKKTTTCDVRNQDPGLGQAQTCGVVKQVNGTPTLSS